MLTFTIEIEESKYESVLQMSPNLDDSTATDLERELFEDLLARIAPGISPDDSIEAQMDYLAAAIAGMHDEPEEGLSGPEQGLSA